MINQKILVAGVFAAGIIGGTTYAIVKTVMLSKNKNVFKEIKINNDRFTEKTISYDFKKIIKGDKSFNNGNYVLYFGSEKCPYCYYMLYGESPNQNNQKPKTEKSIKNGDFYKSANDFSKNEKTKEISFLYFSDVAPEITWKKTKQTFMPWEPSYTIVNGSLKQDFLRNDDSALTFRDIQKTISNIHGEEKGNGIPRIIAYKNGKANFFLEESDTASQEIEKILNNGATITTPPQTKKRPTLSQYLKYLYLGEKPTTTAN